MSEIFISVDVETDGPIPAEFSMLSVGAAAFSEGGELLGTFERNLETLDGAKQNPETMQWWDTQPEAWEACRKNLVHPKDAMMDLTKWVGELERQYGAKAVFLAYPAGFDFTFVYWYLIKFVGYSVFSFSSLDIKSYAMAVLGTPFRETTKRNFPKKWKSKKRHNHVALQDAIGQGELFINILKEANESNITA
jgi:hypothetical protein